MHCSLRETALLPPPPSPVTQGGIKLKIYLNHPAKGTTERQDTEDDDRDSERRGHSSVTTSHSKSQRAEVLNYVDLVNCGDLNAGEVQKARLLEVEVSEQKESREASAALTHQRQD